MEHEGESMIPIRCPAVYPNANAETVHPGKQRCVENRTHTHTQRQEQRIGGWGI